jgi:Pretoxin HINT domain
LCQNSGEDDRIEAKEIRPGDLVYSHDGQQRAIESVSENGDYLRLYNLRVAEWHTYFVGDEEWGISVWAHNQCVNLNSNSAVSNFGTYQIFINDILFKVGKTDMGRLSQFSGLPTRLHQQLTKLSAIFGPEKVSYALNSLGKTTTAEAKLAEKACLQKAFEQTGFVPIGNWKSFRPVLQ